MCYTVIVFMVTVHEVNSYFSTFLYTGVLYTMMIKKKRITAALLALGLGAVTMFSQFPVSAAEETAHKMGSRIAGSGTKRFVLRKRQI